MGTVDRNSMDLKEAEDIRRRGKNTQKNYIKNVFLDSHDGVITHLESVILECQVKWTLVSSMTSKATGGDGIPAELFQNPKST